MARVILGQGNIQGKERQGHRQSISMVSIKLSKERNKWIPDRFPSIFWREINFRTSGATGSTDHFCLIQVQVQIFFISVCGYNIFRLINLQ